MAVISIHGLRFDEATAKLFEAAKLDPKGSNDELSEEEAHQYETEHSFKNLYATAEFVMNRLEVDIYKNGIRDSVDFGDGLQFEARSIRAQICYEHPNASVAQWTSMARFRTQQEISKGSDREVQGIELAVLARVVSGGFLASMGGLATLKITHNPLISRAVSYAIFAGVTGMQIIGDQLYDPKEEARKKYNVQVD